MERGSWKRPVVLEIFGRPGVTTVGDTLDAALVLLGAWPHKRTPAHMAAVTSCRDVLAGRAEPALARVDFIEAALEAGFHVETETFFQAPHAPIDTAEKDEREQRHLPSILSFARPLIRAAATPSAPSLINDVPQMQAAFPPQAGMTATAVAQTPSRWPPPAWASIALDHEIAEQQHHEAIIGMADTVPHTAPITAGGSRLPPLAEVPEEGSARELAEARQRPLALPAFDFDDDTGRDTAFPSGPVVAVTPHEEQAEPGPRHTLTLTGARSLSSLLPRDARPKEEANRKRRVIEWSALPATATPQSDSPGFGELLFRLFDTLGMIGLVTLKMMAGMLNLHLNIMHRRPHPAPAKSH